MTCHCPLCSAANAASYHRDARREYFRCGHCSLVFVAPSARLHRQAEHAEYLLHENSTDDPGYRRFLARLGDPMLERLRVPAQGLDFGCGPAPALAMMFEEAGHTMVLHDSFFRPNEAALGGVYDFVVATEVVEHLHAPGEVLAQLWGCVRPGAYLGLMTKLARDREAFSSWHYIRDPTHVCFFSAETFSWWAERNNAELEIIGADVILLRKPA